MNWDSFEIEFICSEVVVYLLENLTLQLIELEFSFTIPLQ